MTEVRDFIVGSPARDNDFWFRTEFIEDLWVSLKKHNVLLLAPRRTGKTSVMYRLLDNPREGWLVVHLNVEDLKTPGEFVISLLDAINEHQPKLMREVLIKGWNFLKGIFDRIESIKAYEFKIQLRKSESFDSKWKELGDELVERIFEADNKVLFIIDELPDMLNSMLKISKEKHEDFLHWFRKIRDLSLQRNLRWFVGGSVNLVAALDQMGLVRLVNDLKIEPLPPLTEEDVRNFIERMLQQFNVHLDNMVIPKAIELLGAPIPLFLQMLTQELYRFWRRNKALPLSAKAVDEVFKKSLLGEMARDKLQHYRTRINTHYPNEEKTAAYNILDNLCRSDNGLSRNMLFQCYCQLEDKKTEQRKSPALEQAFNSLLMYLQSDFYIESNENDIYEFSSHLLKSWWKKYYG